MSVWERERENSLRACSALCHCLKGILLFQIWLFLNVTASNHINSEHLLVLFHFIFDITDWRITITRQTDGWMNWWMDAWMDGTYCSSWLRNATLQPITQLHSNPFILYSAFYNKIVSRCFTESDTQSRNPQVSTGGKEKLPFNRKKPWAGPDLQGGTFLLRVCRVKEEKERETGQRE